MDIKLPNGKILEGAAEDSTQDEIMDMAVSEGLATYDDFGVRSFGRGQGFLNSLGSGATYGFADELYGLTQMLPHPYGQGKYDAESYRQEQARYANQHPGENIGGEIAGGIAMGLGSAGKMAATKGGKAIIDSVKNLPKLAQWALPAGVGGTVAGAGYAPEGETLEGAVKGGITGVVAGVTLPPVVNAAKYATNKVVGTPLSWAYNKLKKPVNQGKHKINEAILRDGMTPDEMVGNLRNLGPGATMADAGGENVLGLADSVATMPGQARQEIIETVNNRQTGQGGRINEYLKSVLGGEEGFYTMLDNLKRELKEKSSPLYKKAFQTNQSMDSKVIDRILKTPAGKKALRGAAERMQNKMSLMGAPDKELTEQLRFLQSIDLMDSVTAEGMKDAGVSKGMKLQTMDFIKQEFDDMIAAGRKQVRSGNEREGYVRDLVKLKNKFVSELDDLDVTKTADKKGSYALARETYSGTRSNEDALKLGTKFLSEDEEITVRAINAMSEAEKQFYRAGALKAIKDKIYAAPDGADVYKRIFGNKLIRGKMKALFPDEDTFNAFRNTMEAESTFNNTRAAITGNSKTVTRLAGQEDLGLMPEISSGGDLSGGIVRGFINDMKKPSEAVNNNIGSMLMNQNQDETIKVLESLNRLRNPNLPMLPDYINNGSLIQTGNLSGYGSSKF